MGKKTKFIAVRLERESYQRVVKRAADRGLSIAEHVRTLIVTDLETRGASA